MDVIGVGARSSLGLNALQLAMAYRARKFEPRASETRDKRGRRIGVCSVGGLPDECQGFGRWVALAAPALREACLSCDPSSPPPLVLAAPSRGRADDDPRSDGELINAIQERSGLAIESRASSVVRSGHAGGAEAFRRAADLIAGGAMTVVVGGVDSYLHPDLLRELDEAYRIHALDAEDGFVPAEGAAFCVLRGPGRNSAPALARVTRSAVAEEMGGGDGEPNIAAAMTRLVAEAAEGCDWIISDVNAESHRVREWGMVELRRLSGSDRRIERPADELGDLGAASGPLYVALASTYFQLGCAPGAKALVALHSDGPERGVIRLEGGDA